MNHQLTPSMWSALGSMPVVLRRTARGWTKDIGAPGSATLDALNASALVRFVDTMDGQPPRYERTPLGEAVWANR